MSGVRGVYFQERVERKESRNSGGVKVKRKEKQKERNRERRKDGDWKKGRGGIYLVSVITVCAVTG